MDEHESKSRVDQREIRRQLYLKRKKAHQRKQLLVFGGLLLVMILLIVLLCRACASDGSEAKQPTDTVEQPTEPVEQAKSASLVAVGDNLMHQQIVVSAQNSDGSYDFSGLYANLKEDFTAADIACICQETILVNDVADTSNGLPSYGTISELADDIAAAGFDVVAHATEHAYDKGLDGILQTKAKWNTLGVSALGIHDSAEDAESITVREANGIRIAFLNYTYYDDDMTKATEAYAVDYLDDTAAIAAQIAEAKAQADIVIVFAHWGEMTTYQANTFQQTWAQFFADNGVGAVIGSHTHTLQPVEELTGTDGNTMPVFYSLGNYMTHMSRYYNMLGGMAELTITKDSTGTRVSDYRLTPLVEVIDATNGYRFYTVKLSDYTDAMASTQQLEGTGVENMMELYHTIFPETQQTEQTEPSQTDVGSPTEPTEENGTP